MTTTRPLPIIGVTVELLDAPHYNGRRRYQLTHQYMPCLRAAGAVPFLIPADASFAELQIWLGHVDGLLLSGGDDVDLRPFGGPAPTPECKPAPLAQQEMNLDLIRGAIDLDMPMLGVCYGMQMLGLAFDAPVIQHLDEAEAHRGGVRHPVTMDARSDLSKRLGAAPFEVPSFHHQALREPGPKSKLRAAAWSPDGIMEAIEVTGARFAVGVQWHPERTPRSPATTKLFATLVSAAIEYRGSGARSVP